MLNYRRFAIAGATYFITQVTYQRQPWLCKAIARHTLHAAINRVRERIDALILSLDHSNCL